MKVELPARLVWNEERTQRIYPAFAGRVTAIRADLGQAVRPGAVLAQIASPDFGQAQADTARSQVDVQLSGKALQRQRELFEAGIIARKDLDQAEADAARAQADAARAEARTRLYGSVSGINQQLGLVAAVEGVIVERNLNPGQELRPEQSGPGTPALFVVSDPTSLWVMIDARESDSAALRPGASFRMTVPALPGQVFEGRVVAAADAIDPATRTIKVRGLVSNPQRLLKAEMLATAHIERAMGSGVQIPASAVALSGSGHMVFVQVKPGVFEARDIVLGYEDSRTVLVAKGLQDGDQVVSENMLLLARQLRMVRDSEAAPEKKSEAGAPAASAVSSGARKVGP